MKWETVTSGIGQSVFALWNNGKQLVTLALSPGSNAVRVDFTDEKRVFLLRNEGFFRNRTVVCNEYGVRLGYLGFENKEHFIVLNNERFFYALNNSSTSEVTIYKESIDKPLAVCELDLPARVESKGRRSVNSTDKLQFGMLLALCWHLFTPASAEPLSYSL